MTAADDAPPVVDSMSINLHMEHGTRKSDLLATLDIPPAESAPGKGHAV